MGQGKVEILQSMTAGSNSPASSIKGPVCYTVYKYSIRCPSCNRKIMNVRRKGTVSPKVAVMYPGDQTAYIEETRCPVCKTYIGVS